MYIIPPLFANVKAVLFMRNPNRYGSVTKLPGTRSRPWMAREGSSGRQRPIGYAATREEALMLLAEYNRSPWDIDAGSVTLEGLYRLWLEKRAAKLSPGNRSVLKSAYHYCEGLASARYRSIKPYQMQACVDECGRGSSTKSQIKALWGHLDRLALELDVITKQCSSLVTAPPPPETAKRPFAEEEVARLWENLSLPWADSALFLIYTGFRISEMTALRAESVDMEALTLTGGCKTEAGRNRVVPIHSRIVPIVGARLAATRRGWLFEKNGRGLTPDSYRALWAVLMERLGMRHTPHECRHTFRSRLDSAGANKVCIDRLMGHKSGDVGERVYTHKTIEELRLNLELVTN